eukprot:TRINITY_DN9897_c0_g1_i9.p2 TRINITY_DN9897_c0_g1~~TRINITY_DN9897_c0_g1_i9.p2  ORF type:complete len:206 (-),score=35.18 TRINITY_DN9897_c0_g1_i9:45-662(-)
MSTTYKISENLTKIFGIAVLRKNGTRIYSQYYFNVHNPSLKKVNEGNLESIEVQKQFEQKLQEKSNKLLGSKSLKPTETEIFTYENFNILFKQINDILIFLIGDFNENEILLASLLDAIYQALNYFAVPEISCKTVIPNYENLVLVIDEMVDEGIIITTDYKQLLARATMKDVDTIEVAPPQTESKFSGVFNKMRDQISKTLNMP